MLELGWGRVEARLTGRLGKGIREVGQRGEEAESGDWEGKEKVSERLEGGVDLEEWMQQQRDETRSSAIVFWDSLHQVSICVCVGPAVEEFVWGIRLPSLFVRLTEDAGVVDCVPGVDVFIFHFPDSVWN